MRIDTTKLTPAHRVILKMAFELGCIRLRDLGIDIEVIVTQHYHCTDGQVFDGFVWHGDILMGTGLEFIMISTDTLDCTVGEYLQRELTPSS